MCGIIGIFKADKAFSAVKKGLSVLKNRGKDNFGICTEFGSSYSKDLAGLNLKTESTHALGHCLHSVVGNSNQPFVDEQGNIFAANCEIYNWKELDEKYDLGGKNDAEVIFNLLEKDKENNIKRVLEKLDGVYAFAYWNGNKVYLARDIIGIKPLWYTHADGFAFASEKKALEGLGYLDIVELNPRKILEYDIEKDKISIIDRGFFSITPEHKVSLEKINVNVESFLTEAIGKRIPGKKFGVLFSGGIDSTIIALMCKKLGYDFTCYTAAVDHPEYKEAEDLTYAKKIAKKHGFNLKIAMIKPKDFEKYLKKIVPLIEDSNVVKVEVALTLYLACQLAKKDKNKVIFSGLGSEEIFAGYQRHKQTKNINKECVSGLLKIYERDTYRDDVITMDNNLELRLPFLDKKLVDYCLKIPSRYKIKKEGGVDIDKWILRQVGERIGVAEEVVNRKKKGAQYGSNVDKALRKIVKKKKILRSEYLRSFYPSRNLRLGALSSSGKDSSYALYVMQKQNYEISCMITIKSFNKESYMFHTPNIELVDMQAKAMGIPLVAQETQGEKEAELKDLEKAIKKAKEKHKIQGIITGALFSNYQRERIEKICDKLGLKIFSPLWHLNQETEMRELLREGFDVVISAIAADGLDKTWLGRKINEKVIDELVRLNEKIGFNIAGEGGEFESLVLDAPMFEKKIKIKSSEKKMTGEHEGLFIVKKAELVDK